MRSTKKGQGSIEYISLVALTLVLVIPLIIIYFDNASSTEEAVIANQAEHVAKKIRDSAESMYYLGEGSKNSFRVYMPKHITEILIQNNEIVFRASTKNGINEIVQYCPINATGNISTWNGDHTIVVESKGSYVSVYDG